MRALIIGPAQKEQIKALKKLAKENVYSFETTKYYAGFREDGEIRNIDNDKFTIEIPQGYRVTYTHEMQREDVECRHLSVSVRDAAPGFGPHPDAVAVILKEFNFVNKIGDIPSFHDIDDGVMIIEL